jgi:hypothetical protein
MADAPQIQAFRNNSVVTLEPFNVSSTRILWYLLKRSPTDTLPFLRSASSSQNNNPFNNASVNSFLPVKVYGGITVDTFIDVVNDFDWTVSPQTSREDVPVVYLKEKRLLMNSNVSNIANSVFAVTDNVSTVIGANLTNTIKNAFNTVTNATTNFLQPVANAVTDKTGLPQTQLALNLSTIQGFLTNKVGLQTFNNSVLTPYDYLYSVEPTGFNYILPYFGDNYGQAKVNFGGSNDNILNSIVGGLESFAGGAASLINALAPGVYIEKAKQFSMGNQGKDVTIRFPLLNTGSADSISANWQLLFGLIYQNKPGRVTRSIIDMPVIYEVNIPGNTFMPYAFISELSVNFLGARRLMPLDVPVPEAGQSTGVTTISAIIPDAYDVTITLTGLNEETRNFMYASINPGGINGVTVG